MDYEDEVDANYRESPEYHEETDDWDEEEIAEEEDDDA